jgi:hypothetical protein
MPLESSRSWWHGLDRLEKWAMAAWGLLLLIVCAKALGWPRIHSLYPTFANAARNWRAGEDLYSNPSATGDLDIYRYSPLVAAALTPFGLLPDSLGSVLWRLLNAGVCLGGLGWWCRAVQVGRLTPGQRGLLFLLVLPLCIGNLNNAQSNPLVLGLILCSVAAAAEERWNWVSSFIALACLFKVYPIAVGLLLLVVYPRQLIIRLPFVLALGLALPFLFHDPHYVAGQYSAWLDCLRCDDRSAFPLERCYRDLQMLARLSGSPMSPGLYHVLQILAGGGMALLCWCYCSRWERGRLLILLTGLGCCWMTVFGPATESCTYILLAPTLAWALVGAWSESFSLMANAWLTMAYAMLVATYMSCWFSGGYRLQAFGLQPLAGLMLLAYLLLDVTVRARCPVAVANR